MQELSEEQKEEALSLAEELLKLTESHFQEASDERVHARIKTIRTTLEQMGIVVRWSIKLDTATLALSAEVTLYTPKYIH